MCGMLMTALDDGLKPTDPNFPAGAAGEGARKSWCELKCWQLGRAFGMA